MTRIKNYIECLLLNLECLLLLTRIRDLLFVFTYLVFTYIVYIFIKLPLNSLIYSVIDPYVFAFLIAWMLSLIVSTLKYKLFNHLFKRIKYDHILNWSLLDLLVCFNSIIPYRFNVVYYHGPSSQVFYNTWGTMPELSDPMKIEWGKRYYNLRRRHIMNRKTINYFEPIASAMERDGSDRKHIALAHVFREQVRDAKEELMDIHKPHSPMVDTDFYNRQYTDMSELEILWSVSIWTKWF